MLASSTLFFSAVQSIPFPKKIYQVPICAKNQASLNLIKDTLKNKDIQSVSEVEQLMEKHLSEGNLLSAQELLKELKEQIRKDQNTSSSEVLEAINQRIFTLEKRVQNNLSKNYIFENFVEDVSEESLNTTEIKDYDIVRKLCNGGKSNSVHPFEIYEFSLKK